MALIMEAALYLTLAVLVAQSFIKVTTTLKEDEIFKKESYSVLMLESGLKTGFTQILNVFEPICSNIATDTTSSMSWGWQNPNCVNTSPLPQYSGNTLTYNVDLASLAATDKQTLTNAIVSAYAPICKLQTTTATTIALTCDTSINNLQYQVSSGLVSQFHTPGSAFNFLNVPVVVATMKRTHVSGLTQYMPYNISIADVFIQRLNYGLSKMYEIANDMKTFYNQKIALETASTYPNGLNTIDDLIVPYQWEILGNNASLVTSAVCARNTTTGVCDNLNTSSIWQSSIGASPDALTWRRVVQNALNGQTKYSVDGFGNALRMVMIANECSGTNLNAQCGQTPPPIPADNYSTLTTLRAPYSTLVYSGVINGSVNCADASTQAPTSCRFYFSY